MKYLRQFLIIIGITFIAEFVKMIIPLPIPASIYGMLIMLFLLITKVVKIDSIKDTSYFLIEIMPVMFIPPAVKLIVLYKELLPFFLPFIIIVLLSTVLVMIVSGRMTQLILKLSRKKEIDNF